MHVTALREAMKDSTLNDNAGEVEAGSSLFASTVDSIPRGAGELDLRQGLCKQALTGISRAARCRSACIRRPCRLANPAVIRVIKPCHHGVFKICVVSD